MSTYGDVVNQMLEPRRSRNWKIELQHLVLHMGQLLSVVDVGNVESEATGCDASG